MPGFLMPAAVSSTISLWKKQIYRLTLAEIILPFLSGNAKKIAIFCVLDKVLSALKIIQHTHAYKLNKKLEGYIP